MTDEPTKTCLHCAYGIRDGGGMFCRFFPPKTQAVIAMVEDEELGGVRPKVVSQISLWTQVKPDQWCGQFKPE